MGESPLVARIAFDSNDSRVNRICLGMGHQHLQLSSYKSVVVLSLRLLAASSVFFVAWSMFDLRFSPLTFLDVRAFAFASFLLALGLIDRAKGIVPMEITFPLMLAGVVRAIFLSDPSFLLYWFALAIIYLFNVVGGGDVKLLMGMFGLFPHLEFFIVMEIVVIATHLPIVLYRRWLHGNFRAQVQSMYHWANFRFVELVLGELTPHTLLRRAIVQRPSSETLSRRGDRLAIAFSFAGILYLFLCTRAGMNWHIGI